MLFADSFCVYSSSFDNRFAEDCKDRYIMDVSASQKSAYQGIVDIHVVIKNETVLR